MRSLTEEEYRDLMDDDGLYVRDEKGDITGIIVGSQVIPVDDKKSWHIEYKRNPDGSKSVTKVKFRGEKALKISANSSDKSTKNSFQQEESKKNTKFSEPIVSTQTTDKSGKKYKSNKSPNSLLCLMAKRRLCNEIAKDLFEKYDSDIIDNYKCVSLNRKESSLSFVFLVNESYITFRKFDVDFGEPHRYYFSQFNLPDALNKKDCIFFENDLLNTVKNFLNTKYAPLEMKAISACRQENDDVEISIIGFTFSSL